MDKRFSGIHGAFVAKIGYHYISVFAPPPGRHLIGWVDRFEVCYHYRTHIHTLWVHGEGVDELFCCCVMCCTTAVPGTTSCCSTGWHRRRSPAVARPPPPPSGGLWPPSSLARPPSLARSPAVVRSPAAALVIIITTYRYY